MDLPVVAGNPTSGQTIIARARRRGEGTDPPEGRLTLQLRQDRPAQFDKQLKEVTEWGVDIDAELRYECPGSGDASEAGSWRVFAQARDEDGHDTSSERVTVVDCKGEDVGTPDPTTASTSFQYRIEALGDPTNPPDGPVKFTGTRTGGPASSDGVEEVEVTATGDWQHQGLWPDNDFWVAHTPAFNLRPGHWEVAAWAPVDWVRARCEVDLEAGANQSINFQENVAGCARGFEFPGDDR